MISMHDYAHASTEGTQLKFREIMSRIDVKSNGDKEVVYNEELANLEDLTATNERVLTSMTKHVAGEDEDLHATLRRDFTSLTPVKAGDIGAIRLDMFQAADSLEVLFPMKYAMFSSGTDLIERWGSEPFTFNSCYTDEIKILIQLVMLVMMIVSGAHLQKTVFNTKSGTGTCTKGKDELPNWIVAVANKHEPEVGSVQHMT